MQIIPGELARCPLCLLYYRTRPKTPTTTLKSLPKAETSTEAFELGEEQLVFIDRVANKLIQEPKWIQYYKRGLKDVFKGRLDFNTWFDRTKVERGLRAYDLLKILHDSLEGLKSKEIQALRESYKQALQKITQM